MVKISERLQTAASMVSDGYTLADVGTDHGYIPIYLLEQKKIPSAIAMDINEGPLERAKEHIRLYGLDPYIQTRLSDGVEALMPGETDSILIAGMGGGIVMHILEDGKEVCQAAKELILQPQSELERVRSYLMENGYEILAEDMVLEEEKFYPMMKVRYTGTFSTTEDVEMLKLSHLYGGLLLKKQHPVLKTYLEKEQKLFLSIRENLEKQPESEKIANRLEEVKETLYYNGKAMEYFDGEHER